MFMLYISGWPDTTGLSTVGGVAKVMVNNLGQLSLAILLWTDAVITGSEVEWVVLM